MRSTYPEPETDDDEWSIGYDTQDTMSVSLDSDVSSSEFEETSDSGSEPESDAGTLSGEESDDTAIPDEAFGFDDFDDPAPFPYGPEPNLTPQGLLAEIPIPSVHEDREEYAAGPWPWLWKRVELAGKLGFVSARSTVFAPVAQYNTGELVRHVVVHPHYADRCCSAQLDRRLPALPHVDTVRLHLNYDPECSLHMGGSHEGTAEVCHALEGLTPTTLVLRDAALFHDEIPVHAWPATLLSRVTRVVLVVDPGATKRQIRKLTHQAPGRLSTADLLLGNIPGILRALPPVVEDVTVVFYTARPQDDFGDLDRDLDEYALLRALGRQVRRARLGAQLTLVNAESVSLAFMQQVRADSCAFRPLLHGLKEVCHRELFPDARNPDPRFKVPRWVGFHQWLLKQPLDTPGGLWADRSAVFEAAEVAAWHGGLLPDPWAGTSDCGPQELLEARPPVPLRTLLVRLEEVQRRMEAARTIMEEDARRPLVQRGFEPPARPPAYRDHPPKGPPPDPDQPPNQNPPSSHDPPPYQDPPPYAGSSSSTGTDPEMVRYPRPRNQPPPEAAAPRAPAVVQSLFASPPVPCHVLAHLAYPADPPAS